MNKVLFTGYMQIFREVIPIAIKEDPHVVATLPKPHPTTPASVLTAAATAKPWSRTIGAAASPLMLFLHLHLPFHYCFFPTSNLTNQLHFKSKHENCLKSIKMHFKFIIEPSYFHYIKKARTPSIKKRCGLDLCN
jgi:hypothetical protein